jgi:hypothetical protein
MGASQIGIGTNAEGVATDSTTEINQPSPQYIASFNAERTARYHVARRGFFEAVHRVSLFTIVALGTTGVVGLLNNYGASVGITPELAAGLSALLGAINLVFDPAGRARVHENLQRKAFELGAEIDLVVSPSAEDCARWNSLLHRIYAEEPPPKRALDAVVYNATLSGRKEDPADDLLVISFWQQIAKQILPFANAKFLRRCELTRTK